MGVRVKARVTEWLQKPQGESSCLHKATVAIWLVLGPRTVWSVTFLLLPCLGPCFPTNRIRFVPKVRVNAGIGDP